MMNKWEQPKVLLKTVLRTKKEAIADTGSNLLLSENDNRLLFTYKSPYFGESIDITMSERKRLANGEMMNDAIINFYLEYILTTWIDNQFQELGIKSSISNSHTFMSVGETEDGGSEVEAMIRSVLNRFYIFSTFFYPQLHRWKSVRLANDSSKEINSEESAKIKVWSKYHIFDKEFLLIPIFSGYELRSENEH